MKYFINNNNNNNNFFTSLTPQEFYQCFGEEPQIQKIADNIYKNILSIEDVVIEQQETIRAIVNARIEKFGDYSSSQIPPNELKSSLIDASFACNTRQEAKDLIKGFVSLRDNSSDDIADMAPEAYPKMGQTGTIIKAGTRINWNGKVRKAKEDILDIEENSPDKNPSLWSGGGNSNGNNKPNKKSLVERLKYITINNNNYLLIDDEVYKQDLNDSEKLIWVGHYSDFDGKEKH